MRLAAFIAICLLAVAGAPSTSAQQDAPAPAPINPVGAEATRPAAPLTPADIEAWLDGYLPFALEQGDIAGAVVIVVSDRQVLVQRGYGLADVATGARVEPERTLFRQGSVAKLVTWTAVMQLVEQGRLDLDTDVNTYLDFQIPARNGQPITLRHLMTHTAGFEETARDLIRTEPGPSLEIALQSWIPARIFAPGTTRAYSNYGTALAGYIVQRVSGEPFAAYVETHIFEPLGMARSSFRQPLPEELSADLARGYLLASGEPRFFEHVALSPAGSMSATGADMARFMIAHLDDGAVGSARILQPQTAQAMHGEAPQTATAGAQPVLLGFLSRDINGRRVITHPGDTQFFHTDLSLFLDEGVGVYFAMNAAGRELAADNVRKALFEQFADRYFPGADPDGEIPIDVARQHAQAMAGNYETSRRSGSNFLAFFSMLGQISVAATAEGSITVPQLLARNGAPVEWRESAPFVWRDVNGPFRLAAIVEDGAVAQLSVGPYGALVYERAPWWRSSALLAPLLGAAFGVLLLTALSWPIAALVRSRYKARFTLRGQEAFAHRAVRAAAGAAIVTFSAWIALVSVLSANFFASSSAYDNWFIALGALSLVVFGGAFVTALWNAWGAWSGKRSWFSKLWSTLLVLACLLLLWVAVAFKLIGFSANY